MRTKMRKRFNSNTGGGITIFSLAIFMMILLLGIFIIDMTKNSYVSQNYYAMTQRSAQKGLTQQNSIGGLTVASVSSIVNEYLEESRGTGTDTDPSVVGTSETSAFRTNCQKKYPEYPKITIDFSTERTTNIAEEDFSSKYVYSSGAFAPSLTDNNPLFYQKSYRTIRVVIEDISDNYFFSMFGRPCSIYTTQATAVAIDADAGITGK